MAQTRRPFIIDCDTGTDDAQAILMALAHPDIELVAVTAVFGNTTVENTTRNALRILKFMDRTDIPVYKGSDWSLLGTPSINDGYHGKDGLGDITIPGVDPIDMSKVPKEHAAQVLVRLANERPGELTLVATGPLTNLAIALQLDPQLGSKLKDVCVMGGNMDGRGNITVCSEFNFSSDPEAAQFVLNHLGKRVLLSPLEMCERQSFSWEWYDDFIAYHSPIAKLIGKFEDEMTSRERKKGIPSYIMIWDQVAMATAIDQHVAMETQDVYVTVELRGELTRGQAVVDWRNKLKQTPNVCLVLDCDHQKFEKLMYSIVGREQRTRPLLLSRL